uniref:Uncharacterized protein n=1 Tax=Anguilla anguilla TaxID=7936 RepID=A0A0E9XCC4_ANGAN
MQNWLCRSLRLDEEGFSDTVSANSRADGGNQRRLLSGLLLRLRPPLLLLLGGPLTKPQSTLIGCPIMSCPFSPSMAAWASL